MKRRIILSIFVFGLVGCGGGEGATPTSPTPPTQPAPVVTSITMSATSLTLDAGQTAQLSATVKDQYGAVMTGKTVTWTSSDAPALRCTWARCVKSRECSDAPT